mmetsp:Transcript_162432/g.520581  ORF Transcript_162432/g.520581 Transcript_162432/m.520581 type:complete len:815 (-) Transcript_162432:240-2684(-)
MSSWKWEVFAAVTASCFLALVPLLSPAHVALMYGSEPGALWDQEKIQSMKMDTVLILLVAVSILCQHCPVRCCILWVVPLSALVSFARMECIAGCQHTCSAMLMLLAVSFSLYGARRQERQLRERWLTKRRIVEQDAELEEQGLVAQAFYAVAGSLCDAVVELDKDARFVGSDRRHEAFFGRPMHGRGFTEVLAKSDRGRFLEVLSEASTSHTHQSMPATLELGFATLHVQLLVVAAEGRTARYFVGLHSVESFYQDGMPDVRPMATAPRLKAAADRSYQVATHMEGDDSSVAESVQTEKVFGGLRHCCPEDVFARLGLIAAVGKKEQWLIPTNEVELFPEMKLGGGSFGIVVAARLRGTMVAAKVAKKVGTERGIRLLSSVANELRVLRYTRHPNIAALYGACIDPEGGELALLSELVVGTTLDVFVQTQYGGSSGADRHGRLKLLIDIAGALRYLHGLRPPIVHGDVKPSNILVEGTARRPRAKVLDFGLSRMLTVNARPLGGSRHWTAPELISSMSRRPSPSTSADVFSFGLLARFVVARLLPGQTPELTTAAPGKGERKFRSDCLKVYEACMVSDPKGREDMRSVHNALINVLPQERRALLNVGWDVVALGRVSLPWADGLRAVRQKEEEALEAKSEVLGAVAKDSSQASMSTQGHLVSPRGVRPMTLRPQRLAGQGAQRPIGEWAIASPITAAAPVKELTLAYPKFKETTEEMRTCMVIDMLQRWNILCCSKKSCCVWHSTLGELEAILERLACACMPVMQQPSAQCPECGALSFREGEGEGQDVECSACKLALQAAGHQGTHRSRQSL